MHSAPRQNRLLHGVREQLPVDGRDSLFAPLFRTLLDRRRIAFTHTEGADVKMKLRLEALEVESFEPAPAGAGALGTVRAHADTADAPNVAVTDAQTCWTGVCPGLPGICTCDGGPTCDVSGCYACKQTQAAGCVVGLAPV